MTYKPGQTAPRTGEIQCVEYHGTRKHIRAGETFPPCDNWGEHHGPGCTWRYL
jgi:hypothetical protein